MNRLVLALSLCIICNSSDSQAQIPQQIARLEAGVQRAEAIRAVKRLQYAYGHYAELGLWNDFADLFAENAVGYYPSGKLGKEGIRKLFLQEVGKGKLGLDEGRLYPHIILQPVVSVASDGKTAKGRWRVLAMLGNYGGMALWAGGVYENEYILENGAWKINDLHYYSQYSGRYDQPGWTADKEKAPFHFNPARAGTPILETTSQPAPAETSPSVAALSARFGDLARRVQRLNDENQVENLQHIYGYYTDRKMWNDVADLFANDATMELGRQGVYVGKTSIRRALNQFGPQGLREGELNDHLQLQTIVHIEPDGRTAKARGVELIMSGINGVGGEWAEGIFENEYIKQNGVWRIKSMHVYPRMYVDYEKGWAKDARPAPGPSKEFPPDRPPTGTYEVYPKFQTVPFHFANPATGKPTQYPEGTVAAGRTSSLKPWAASLAEGAPAVRTIAELSKGLAEAEHSLKIAVAYDAAENLASAYGYYLDEFMWDETADLFARDGWKELSYVGIYVGRERIRQSLKLRYPGGKPQDSFTVHQIIQPVIHVAPDGRSAKMRVRLFQLSGISGGKGSWTGGIYENEMVPEDDMWKLKAMDLEYVWTADYRGGWAHVADNANAGVPQIPIKLQFPPDRPLRGVVVAPFPKIVDLPFHYKNPVTGRRPPVFVP